MCPPLPWIGLMLCLWWFSQLTIPFQLPFPLFCLSFFSFDTSDFRPAVPRGCWNISAQVKAGITGGAAPYLNHGQSNPGKCTAHCNYYPFQNRALAALTRGGTCYCIHNFTKEGSSNACTSTCGKHQQLWPGYLCGSATDSSIVNVYEMIPGKWFNSCVIL